MINSPASYMFQQPVVAIFREAFFEGYIYRECQYNLIYKDKMLSFKYSFKSKLAYKILTNLYVWVTYTVLSIFYILTKILSLYLKLNNYFCKLNYVGVLCNISFK